MKKIFSYLATINLYPVIIPFVCLFVFYSRMTGKFFSQETGNVDYEELKKSPEYK